jgi:hypothetical protein
VSAIRYHETPKPTEQQNRSSAFFLAENWHTMHSHDGMGFGVLDESSFKQQMGIRRHVGYSRAGESAFSRPGFSHVWEPQFWDANTGSVLQSVKCKIIFPLTTYCRLSTSV